MKYLLLPIKCKGRKCGDCNHRGRKSFLRVDLSGEAFTKDVCDLFSNEDFTGQERLNACLEHEFKKKI